MKLTVAELRTIIKEAIKASLTDEETVVPGRPVYDEPNVSQKDATKLGDGVWPGAWLDEEDLGEEVADENVVEMIIHKTDHIGSSRRRIR